MVSAHEAELALVVQVLPLISEELAALAAFLALLMMKQMKGTVYGDFDSRAGHVMVLEEVEEVCCVGFQHR